MNKLVRSQPTAIASDTTGPIVSRTTTDIYATTPEPVPLYAQQQPKHDTSAIAGIIFVLGAGLMILGAVFLMNVGKENKDLRDSKIRAEAKLELAQKCMELTK